MQDLDAIEQQMMLEWETGQSDPPISARERSVPHPLSDVVARVNLVDDRRGHARFRYSIPGLQLHTHLARFAGPFH
ncbi:MAG: hypothetical protein PWQ61_3282 [Betaproteobacteria bacterium]|nr:hypothetical protein [Betaproteobacteria bacterium]